MQQNTDLKLARGERKVHIVEDSRTSTGDRLRKISRGVWVVSLGAQFMLLFRFLLQLLEANSANPFARLVYAISDVLMLPFNNLVSNPTFGGIVVDAQAVIAMLVYMLATWLLVEVLWVVFYGKRHTETIVEEKR
ncbi:MAG: hypothetical protein EPO32_10440 [Anaerolineae bacterium]|nr:MAG: hypothetical protein EPO32_10440 [Anaerolineae bacterium]